MAESRTTAPPEFARALELIRSGDVEGFRSLIATHRELARERHKPSAAPVDPTTLLKALAQPELPCADLRFAEILIGAGAALDVPLNDAACFNNVALVRRLLDAGGDMTR